MAIDKQTMKPFIKGVSLGLLAAVGILFVLFHQIAAVIKIEGSSMNPVLKDQERIILLRTGAGENRIHRFDIVVFSVPGRKGKKLIKRVIGLPGEKIEIKEGRIFINHRELSASDSSSPSFCPPLLNPMNPLTIPRGHYFVMGDNPGISLDSRTLGLVPARCIIGKAILRYWPLSRLGSVS